ncbi:MAG: hypothetical protein ABFC56_11000 [Clostridiaceae bacterium]
MCAICSLEKSVEDFTLFIKESFGDLLFNKTAAGVETGYFAFQHDKSLDEYTFESDISWRKNVESISKTAEFKKIFPIFTKFKLLNENNRSSPKIVKRNGHSFYKLHYNRQYIAAVDYFMPDSDVDPDNAWLDFKIGSIPNYLRDTIPTRTIGTKAGFTKFAFSLTSICKNGELLFQTTKTDACNKRIVFSTRPIPFKAIRSWWRWGLIILCVILLLVSSVIKDFKAAEVLSDITERISTGEVLVWYDKIQLFAARFLDKIKVLYPAVMNLVITGLTFSLIVLLGKKDN